MIQYIKNQNINNAIFIKEIEPFIRKNGYKRRVALFICQFCKEEFTSRIEKVKSSKIASCGCRKGELISKAKTTHGSSGTHLYFVWHNMKVRCYNKNNNHYQWYGSRGISICKEWRDSFIEFKRWALGAGWSRELEIDRRDNDGNYEPSNCRFITHKENMNNSRELTKANKSGFRNVHKINNGYRVVIKKKHICVTKRIEDAVIARDKYRESYVS